MICTRKRGQHGTPLQCVPVGAKIPMSVRKLMSGGAGGRIQVPIVRNEEVRTLNTWNFDSITRPNIAPLPPSTPGLPHSNNNAKETQILLDGNIIVSEDKLRKSIQENVVCQTCIDNFHHKRRVRFHRFCDTYRRNAFTSLLESGKTTDEMLTMASDVLKKTTTTLWKDFLRLDVVKNNTGPNGAMVTPGKLLPC